MCVGKGAKSRLADDVQREHAVHGREFPTEFHLLLQLARELADSAGIRLAVLGPICVKRSLQRAGRARERWSWVLQSQGQRVVRVAISLVLKQR